MRWILVDVPERVAEVGEVDRRVDTVTGTQAIVRVRAQPLGHSVVNLPRDLRLIQLLENIVDIELGQVVVAARIFYQTLSGASREGSNPVGNALARHGREPAVRNRELGSHVVVVVQEIL